jgi:F-type H+-transporting ATPase subunit a
MIEATHFVAVNIPVGDHITRHGFNLDTIWTTTVACLIVLGTGLYLARKATSGVPGRLQLFWETIVGTVQNQVEANLSPKYRHVVPLGVAIFMLVLTADWLEILPGLWHNTDYSPAPTADVNLTYALGITVFVLITVASMREKGVGGYFAHFFRKPRAMFLIHIVEEITKPLTLALRLFGNLFSGGIMIALLISFPFFVEKFSVANVVLTIMGVAFEPVWKLFDMFIGVIQAFIFALLTILYYQFATEEGGH